MKENMVLYLFHHFIINSTYLFIVFSIFEKVFYLFLQISSPYIHYNQHYIHFNKGNFTESGFIIRLITQISRLFV